MTTTQIAPELAHLDPRSLVIGTNARIDVSVDAELVASIREHGVIEPLIAHRDDEGRVIVRAGQRRTLAAVEAEVATVPVYITEAPADDAARIIEQVEENDRRAAMTQGDRVNIAAELALLGLTPSQIAKRTKRDRAEVDAALAVANNDASRARMADDGLDLFAAAALAEFEGDEDATSRIEQSIRWGNGTAHTVARIRADRAAAALIGQRAAELLGEGVRVIDQPARWQGYGPKPATLPLSDLMDKDGEGWGHRAEAHAQVCKGHVLWLASDGETVTETVGCEDWRSHGHKPYSSGVGGSTQSAEERRAVIEGNKAWLAAREVRREFVQGIAKAPKTPKGAERFVTKSIACGNVTDASSWYTLRGVKMPEQYGRLDKAAAARAMSNLSAAKLAVVNLCMVMGSFEAQISDKGSWRHCAHTDVAEYLTTLQGWGYTLSDAEAQYVERAAETVARMQAIHEAVEQDDAEQDDAEQDDAEQDEAE